jgi:hypothetical protein
MLQNAEETGSTGYHTGAYHVRVRSVGHTQPDRGDLMSQAKWGRERRK